MEEYSQPAINILLKLSSCINILRFYGKYSQCEELMLLICKDTMKFWRENDGLISVNIQIRRPRFICFKEFHEKISEYLLKDNRFERYELDIKIKGGAYNMNNLPTFSKFLSKIKDRSTLELNKILFELCEWSSDEFEQIISNNLWIKKLIQCSGHWLRMYGSAPNYYNPVHYNFIRSRHWSCKRPIESEIFAVKNKCNNEYSYKLEGITANKLIISYSNLINYLKDELIMPGSLENSIKYVRICKFYKVKFCSIEEKILQLKSKLKLANYFELQTHTLFKVNLNCLIRLNSDHRLKRLIICGKNRTNETTYFTIINTKILIKQYDKLALFKIKKLKIKILASHPLNYFDNDVIVIRAVKFIDMIGMQIISDESDLSAKLQSYQNTYSPGYENIPCIVLLNKNIQNNITKNFKIKDTIYFRLWGCRMEVSMNEIKVNQLPVTLILLSSYVSFEYQEEICEAIEGYNVVGFEADLLPTMYTDLVKKILLRILNNNHHGIFMKINKEIEFRNFTNEKREYLKEVLENNQLIYRLNKCEFDFMSYIEIKE